ncbi:MAG: caspase family protein [Deltaproteobacteria bacterium]|nr:caspase family protein [Deltaproteobacteria bacterium]
MQSLLKRIIPIIVLSFILPILSIADEKPEIFIQMGHPSQIASVAFSPDGRYALSGSYDKTIKLWEVGTGREIRTFKGHSDFVNSVAFGPDGRCLISGSKDGSIRLWEVSTGKQVRTWRGHEAGVYSLAFSSDGRYILSGGVEYKAHMKLWEAATGKLVRSFSGHSDLVYSVAFSPDGRYAISGSQDHTAKLWEVGTGRGILTFKGHSNNVRSVAFSPDGRYALSGSTDKTVKIWEVATGRELRTFLGHTSYVNCVAFSPDGHYVFSASHEGVSKLWEAATGNEVRTFRYQDRRKINNSAISVAFSPDGRYLLTGHTFIMGLWEIATGREVITFEGPSNSVNAAIFSPDGRYAIVANTGYPATFWEVTIGRELRILQGDKGTITSMVFSPDGRYVLSGGYGKAVTVWEAATGRQVSTFPINLKIPIFYTFSHDGQHVIVGHEHLLTIWEVATGKEIRTFRGHSNRVRKAAFSPDGRYVLSDSFDNTVRLWETLTGRQVWIYEEQGNWLDAVAFSPDGHYALTTAFDNMIKLREVATGKEMRTLQGHSGSISSLAFSPDVKYILSGSWDETLRLWEVATGRQVWTFQGYSGAVQSVAFSPDGRYVLVGYFNGSIKLLNAIDGNEVCMLAKFRDGEWTAFTPEGYFNASKNGPAYINVRIGNRVFGLDQFYDVFYRPDIVEAKLKGEDIRMLAPTNLEEALLNPPPVVEFVQVPSESADTSVKISYKITSTGGGIGEVRLFHNGKLIQSDGFYRQTKVAPTNKTNTLLAFNSRAIKDYLRSVALVSRKEDKLSLIESAPKGDIYEGTITVDAISGENDIGLAAFNRNNSVQSILKTATFKSTVKQDDPHLYVVAVGIDEYKAVENNLKYAVKDAESITRMLQERSKTQYKPESIHIITLKNADATKINIINKINELSKIIKPDDVFVLFMASHGVLQSGLYSIVTHDYSGNLNNNNLINSNEIMEISKIMKALTQIFILDTCHAGGLDNFVSGLYDARMTVMARNMGLHMFASASSTQEALDGYKGKHGMFTYMLLEGLNNNRNADTNKDSKVSIYELGSYAKEQTTKYSKESGHTQTPVVNNFGKDLSVYVIR